jgi:tetratricopeptide (TPR) repeat protein
MAAHATKQKASDGRRRWLGGWVALGLLLGPSLAAAEEASPAAYRESYALEAKGDMGGALRAIDRVEARGDAAYVLALRRGWLLYLGGSLAEAAQAYAKAVALAPRSAEARLGAMLPLMAQRRWDEAEKLGADAVALAPGDTVALARLASVHYQQGRYAKAEALYRQALALYPSSADLRSGLAWSLLLQGQKRAAREEFDTLLAVAPDHAAGLEGLARCTKP